MMQCASQRGRLCKKYFGTLESPRFEQTKQRGAVVATAHASEFSVQVDELLNNILKLMVH